MAMNEDLDAPFVRWIYTFPFANANICGQVKGSHFQQAAISMRRRITPEMLEELEDWRDQVGV